LFSPRRNLKPWNKTRLSEMGFFQIFQK
jgi:hypothetical protein